MSNNQTGGYQTVVIVGAPRSGTNMLRDVLTAVPGIGTWDCDEIPLLWKHGNLEVVHDELSPAHARPPVRDFLHREFDKAARRLRAEVLVEKTCATSLRVPFVDTVFPQARFVFIHRDGIDAAASAVARWHASFDLTYTLKKARYIPPADLPRHLVGFARRQAARRQAGRAGSVPGGGDQTPTWWGPRPHDFRELMRAHPVDEVAFLQWQRCIDAAADALAEVAARDPDRVLTVRYEDYVADAKAGTARVLDFLGRRADLEFAAYEQVRAGSVGKGRAELGAGTVARLEALGGHTLERFGYA